MKDITDTINLLIKHIANIDSKTVHLDGAETVTGDKAFTGGVTVGGYEPECVVDKGEGYIRYSSGLQMCFGDVAAIKAANVNNANVTIAYAKPFTRVASVQLTSKQFNYYSSFAHRVETDTNNINCDWWTDNSNIMAVAITCYGFYLAIGFWK
jgi:hypothetical protein